MQKLIAYMWFCSLGITVSSVLTGIGIFNGSDDAIGGKMFSEKDGARHFVKSFVVKVGITKPAKALLGSDNCEKPRKKINFDAIRSNLVLVCPLP